MAVKKANAKTRTSIKSAVKPSQKKKPLVKKAAVKKSGAAKKSIKPAIKKSNLKLVKKVSKSEKAKLAKNSSEKPVVLKAIKGKLTAKELEYFRNLILEEKNEILENARRLRESLVDENTGEYVGDHSTFSMHMAEQGSDEMEREKAFMFIQRDEKYLGYL